MNTVPGLDVSFWQADVNWRAVRSAGYRFVFIKATEGVGYTDSTFPANWEGAGAAGLLRGAYCFFHPNQDARQQAQRFVEAMKERDADGELPCSIDLEVADGISNKKIITCVKTWLDEVEQGLGRRPLIYSGLSFLETNLVEQGQPPGWLRDYALWLGWFPKKYVAGMTPLMPHGWSRWTFWQYSGKGRVNGIAAEVDLDLFNGTMEQLLAFAEANTPASVPVIHVVASGETLHSIADKYHVSLVELANANPQLLTVGMKLSVPGQTPAPNDPPRTYTVKPGDSLYTIASKHGTSIAVLVARNR
ncbi:MAG TPA: GH25 family lysozyme, partial [Anaerolineales bacterium]|nr:GH25 family lysozyme [Anaerolineales bacterium]